MTISHKQRKAINAKRNKQLRNETGGGLWVPPEQQSDIQGFWLLLGMNVIGVQTESNIVNGQLYKALDTKTLQVLGTHETVQLSDVRCIRPAHCLVFYSSQGNTAWSHPHVRWSQNNDNHGHRRRPLARNQQITCRRGVQSVSAQPTAVSKPTFAKQ